MNLASIDDVQTRTTSIVMQSVVWILRISLGAILIVSGFAKGVDPWGTLYKIEEYLAVWDMSQPRTIVLLASFVLSWGEFLLGSLLMLGCYRRVIVWLASAMMTVMTFLTAWIWIDDPVADCGCFGDFIVLSNGATFAKNLIIDIALIFMLRWNHRVPGMFNRYSQWIVGAFLTLYIAIIGLLGYNIQPILDFRRFPVGTDLTITPDNYENVSYSFIYERNGEKREFSEDNLPDSTWTFIDRKITGGNEMTYDGFSVSVDGVDVTSDIVGDGNDNRMLVIVPDARRVNPSHTYKINEIDRLLGQHDTELITLLAPDRRGVDWWIDMSMTESDLYTVEPTLLKELARGNIALVYLENGVIKWKRTLSATEYEHIDTLIDEYSEYPGNILTWLTGALATALILLWAIDRTGLTINDLFNRRRLKALRATMHKKETD